MANVYVTGKVYWTKRLFELDEYRGNKFWTVKFYPDPDSMPSIKAAGKQVKKDDDGEYVTLRRNLLKTWKLKPGESAEFTPPDVLDADNKPWDPMKLIGNGSKATVRLDVYATRNGPGSRLEAVRIDELIEYVAPGTDAVPTAGAGVTPAKPFPF